MMIRLFDTIYFIYFFFSQSTEILKLSRSRKCNKVTFTLTIIKIRRCRANRLHARNYTRIVTSAFIRHSFEREIIITSYGRTRNTNGRRELSDG